MIRAAARLLNLPAMRCGMSSPAVHDHLLIWHKESTHSLKGGKMTIQEYLEILKKYHAVHRDLENTIQIVSNAAAYLQAYRHGIRFDNSGNFVRPTSSTISAGLPDSEFPTLERIQTITRDYEAMAKAAMAAHAALPDGDRRLVAKPD